MFTKEQFEKMNSKERLKIYRCYQCGRIYINQNPKSLCPICKTAGLSRELEKTDTVIICSDCEVPIYTNDGANIECPVCGKTDNVQNVVRYATHRKHKGKFKFGDVKNWFVDGDYKRSNDCVEFVSARRFLQKISR